MMQQDTVSDLIRTYFAAFLANDKKTLEEGLSDDFTFTSPRDDHISKATFFERCLPGSENIQTHQIRSFLSTGTKPLFVIKLNSRMAPRFGTRSIIRSKETKSEKLKSTLGLYNPKKSIEAFFNPLLS